MRLRNGGRCVTEEGISQLVFGYAADHHGLDGIQRVDYNLLKAIADEASIEVNVCTAGEWEIAIVMAYKVWRKFSLTKAGESPVDLDAVEWLPTGDHLREMIYSVNDPVTSPANRGQGSACKFSGPNEPVNATFKIGHLPADSIGEILDLFLQ